MRERKIRRKKITCNFICICVCVFMCMWTGSSCVYANDTVGYEYSACQKNVLYKYSPEEHNYVKCKAVALTFDDGPHPKYTPKTLDLLEEKNIRATFFAVGFRSVLHPHLLVRMRELKCEIGNHTYNHADLSKISEHEIHDEILKCNKTIFNATGEYPSIYRPPFGLISKQGEKNIEMKKVLWDIDSYDWNTADAEKVAKKIISSVKDGDIILMHDFYEQTVQALPLIIDGLREEGYEFVTVSELIRVDN